MYSVGDKVVYPRHGAGRVVRIEQKEVLGQMREYLTIEIQDRLTQDIVYRALQCTVQQQQWQIVRGIVTGTFNFEGIAFANEATQ